MSLTKEVTGRLAFCAVVDGYVVRVTFAPNGADATTTTRALAALQGAMQALEDGRWPISLPEPRTTSQPS